MIDLQRRAELALLLRRLASGRLPAPDFEDVYYEFEASRPGDAALSQIAYFGWTLFSDWDEHLVGDRAPNAQVRRMVARSVLFLRSGREYPWPLHPPPITWRDLVSVVTLGSIHWKHPDWPRWERAINFDTWPFATEIDLAEAARRWPFGSERGAQAV